MLIYRERATVGLPEAVHEFLFMQVPANVNAKLPGEDDPARTPELLIVPWIVMVVWVPVPQFAVPVQLKAPEETETGPEAVYVEQV